jgi:hypothetical protein
MCTSNFQEHLIECWNSSPLRAASVYAERREVAVANDRGSVQAAFAADLKALLEKDGYIWRGVYDDTRFDRHVRTYVRKLTQMTKANAGFENLSRFQ